MRITLYRHDDGVDKEQAFYHAPYITVRCGWIRIYNEQREEVKVFQIRDNFKYEIEEKTHG